MIRTEVKEILIRILINEMDLFESDIKEEKVLEETGMDSLDVLAFISICEDKFNVKLDDEVILATSTIQSVIDYIYNCKN